MASRINTSGEKGNAQEGREREEGKEEKQIKGRSINRHFKLHISTECVYVFVLGEDKGLQIC